MPKPTLFVVTDELQQVLDNLPAVEPKSQLDPLRPFILRWRREGRTYRDIRAILKNRCRVVVCLETIRKFVKSRSKPRKPKLGSEVEFDVTPKASQTASQPNLPRYPQAQAVEDRWAEARERMRKFKEEPVAPKPAKIFEVSEEDLDGTKPLRMMTPTPREK